MLEKKKPGKTGKSIINHSYLGIAEDYKGLSNRFVSIYSITLS